MWKTEILTDSRHIWGEVPVINLKFSLKQLYPNVWELRELCDLHIGP